jgi:hypothetical protein
MDPPVLYQTLVTENSHPTANMRMSHHGGKFRKRRLQDPFWKTLPQLLQRNSQASGLISLHQSFSCPPTRISNQPTLFLRQRERLKEVKAMEFQVEVSQN